MSKKLNVWIFIGAVLALSLAIFYWSTPANLLPSFMPGYDSLSGKIHFKHGLAAFFLGAGLFIWLWFRTGKNGTHGHDGHGGGGAAHH